jgi:signal transduction histidine kinase
MVVFRKSADSNYLEAQKKQKEKFTEQLMESQENERVRVANELHDAVGQDLLIIKNLSTMAVQNKGEKNRDDYLADISEKSQNTIDEIRLISRNLRPYLIERLGLTKAIEAMIGDLEISSDIVFQFHSSDIDHCFPAKDEIHVYRIVQECVNNILKHSKAKEAVITLVKKNNLLAITIKDDGIGMGESGEKSFAQKFGFGLSGIKEWVRILNGKFILESSRENGTKIYITIPINYEK